MDICICIYIYIYIYIYGYIYLYIYMYILREVPVLSPSELCCFMRFNAYGVYGISGW